MRFAAEIINLAAGIQPRFHVCVWSRGSIWREGWRRKLVYLRGNSIGAMFAFVRPMSSFGNIYMKMAPML